MYRQTLTFVASVVIGVTVLIFSLTYVLKWHIEFDAYFNEKRQSVAKTAYQSTAKVEDDIAYQAKLNLMRSRAIALYLKQGKSDITFEIDAENGLFLNDETEVFTEIKTAKVLTPEEVLIYLSTDLSQSIKYSNGDIAVQLEVKP